MIMLIVFIILLKFLIPALSVFFPFVSGWANFVLDTIDGDILIPLGLNDATYQPIDKLADWATYIAMVIVAYRMRWPFRKLVLGLFIFRSIGQLAFLLTGKEILFFIFPNFLEPFFLVVVTALAYKRVIKRLPKWKEATYEWVFKYKWLIGVLVFIYKMQDEYITHVGNLDRSEIIKKLFGG